MRLKTLGRAEIEGSTFLRPKPLLLLAYLAVEGPRERQHLRELFWPNVGDAALNLRVLLSQTRSALPGVLVEEHHQLRLGVPSDVADLMAACKAHSKDISALYSGAFLKGLTVTDIGSELEEWMLVTREFLANQVRAHLIFGAETMASAGNLTPAAALAEEAWTLPGSSPVGIGDLQRLYGVLSSARHSLSTTLEAEARELGVDLQRVPDHVALQRTEKVNALRNRGVLPKVASTFIGRATELGELHQLVSDPEVRLLTLLGPGGIGKTRLALELAHTSVAEKVFFVSLEAIQQVGEVVTGISRALGIDLSRDQDALVAIQQGIGSEKVLLILDNFEHLLPADGTVSSLLDACEGLTVLVTSRERLGLDWESIYPLGGLNTRAEEQGDAVRLFVHRARKANGRFQLTSKDRHSVVEICRHVAGSPLGIELAAAWVRTLSIAQISAELARDLKLLEWQVDNHQDSHRNLRLIFDLAWSRLVEHQQQLLSGLAVFWGGFTREQAGTVLDATLPHLLTLVDASLLMVSEAGRYDLHPLLLSYVREKLSEDPARQLHLQGRHARYFATQGEEAWNAIENGQSHDLWTVWEKVEYNNLKTALEWAQQNRQVELALRLCRAQIHEWVNRGQVREGSESLLALLTVAGNQKLTSAYRWALVMACYLRQCLDRWEWNESDRERLDLTLEYMREANDTMGLFRALNLRAISIATEYSTDRSLLYFHEALQVAEHGHFPSGQVAALSNLGQIALLQLDSFSARAYLVRAVKISVENRLDLNRVTALLLLGRLESYSGNYKAAVEYFLEMSSLSTYLGTQFGMKASSINMGEAVFFRSTLSQSRQNGDLKCARTWFERAVSFSNAAQNRVRLVSYSIGLGDVILALGDADEARDWFENKLAESLLHRAQSVTVACRSGLGSVDYEKGLYRLALEHFRYTLTGHSDLYTSFRGIENLAATLGKMGKHQQAVTLWGAAAHFRQSKSLPLPPIFKEQYESALQETRVSMNEAAFQNAWKEGECLSPETAIDIALEWSS